MKNFESYWRKSFGVVQFIDIDRSYDAVRSILSKSHEVERFDDGSLSISVNGSSSKTVMPSDVIVQTKSAVSVVSSSTFMKLYCRSSSANSKLLQFQTNATQIKKIFGLYASFKSISPLKLSVSNAARGIDFVLSQGDFLYVDSLNVRSIDVEEVARKHLEVRRNEEFTVRIVNDYIIYDFLDGRQSKQKINKQSIDQLRKTAVERGIDLSEIDL